MDYSEYKVEKGKELSFEKKEELKIMIKDNHARKSELAENMKKTYQIVWDLCTDEVQERL